MTELAPGCQLSLDKAGVAKVDCLESGYGLSEEVPQRQ